ncbi:MAG TPA: helix-turn-helix domain-containing protein [Gaiellaceae bacterium]|nr:helix-turn-helix domain-containing protein [Gaiellaceae bacterium]
MNDTSAHTERSGGTSGRRLIERTTEHGDRLLTAAELGHYLGLSASTVLDRWQAGHLPGFKLFGRTGPVRFRLSEIEATLADWHVGVRA